MKIAYAIRRYAPEWDVISRYVAKVARELTSHGHQTFIITDSPSASPAGLGPAIVHTRPAQSRWDYLTDEQRYADRLYETLKLLHRSVGLDAVEFADRGAEGLATIRAKRLLGEFASTGIILRLYGPSALVAKCVGDVHINFRSSILAFAEDYCIRHADLLMAPSVAVESYVRQWARTCMPSPYPLSPDDFRPLVPIQRRPENHIVFGGTFDRAGGIDTFLAAAEQLVRKKPKLTFTLFGPRGYPSSSNAYDWERHIGGSLRNKLTVVDPTKINRATIWRGSRYCVFPARWDNTSYEALEAMSHGCIVVCSDRGGMATLIRHGESGFLVNPDDPDDLTQLLLQVPQNVVEISQRAADEAQKVSNPTSACAQILSGYSECPRRPLVKAARTRARVSVIIPVFNAGYFLKEAVASAKGSRYSNIEIIVVNDGSTDADTVDAFEGLEEVIKISKENGGPASALNAGLSQASGDFILPLDADDLIHRDYISTAVRALERNDSLSYVTCYHRSFGLFNVTHASVGYVPDLMLFLYTEPVRGKVFRRAALDAVGGYDENLSTLDDWEIQIRLAKIGRVGDVLPRALYRYRRHVKSLTFTISHSVFTDEMSYVLAKHRDLAREQVPEIISHLLYLWKHKVELSWSARWLSNVRTGGTQANRR